MRVRVDGGSFYALMNCDIPVDQGCTIYRHEGYGYKKYQVSRCHWQEQKSAVVTKSGVESADEVVAYIPFDATVTCVIPKDELSVQKLYPIIDRTHSGTAQDLLVKGTCDFNFDNTSEQTASESYREFFSRYEVYAISDIKRYFYGPKELWHVKITAR